ncbi:MAG: hypothetical protein RIQ56_1026 [Candidatus Parcubacteria bacterium]|jgi:glycosyltransferase involved in cell wall biosynthesis
MKRILIFSLAYAPKVGGAEIAIQNITERISDIQFELITHRFSREHLPQEKMGNVLVHRVGEGGGYFGKILFIPRAALLALRLHRASPFDGMWAMMSYMLLPVVIMRFLNVRIPYLLTLQEGDTYDHMFGRLRVLPLLPILALGFRNATVVQSISQYLGRWARSRGYQGDVIVVPNGCDFFSFEKRGISDREVFWRSYGFSPKFVAITTSRLVHKNAIDVIVQALSSLDPSMHLVVVGGGPERHNLETLVRAKKLSDRVHFLGEIENNKLPDFLHQSDVFIRPSRSEGMGISFIEAMAAGLPVIATQEGGIADFLFDEQRNPDQETTGWAVDVDAPEQISAAVRDILSRPQKVQNVVDNAKKMVREKYDWDIIARVMRKNVFGKLFREV